MKNTTISRGECTTERLDLSTLPLIENSIIDNRLQPIECFSQLPRYAGGSLDFYVEPSGTEYISLSDSFITFRLKVVKITNNVETDVVDGVDRCSYVPMIAQTLIKQIKLRINDQLVTDEIDTYHAYQSYVMPLLYLSKRNIKTQLETAGGVYNEHPGLIDPSFMDEGLLERYRWANAEMDFSSPIIHPLFLTPRLLPTKCELNLSLVLNSSDFCLTVPPIDPADSDTFYKRKRRIGDPEGEGDVTVLSKLPDKYQIKVMDCKLYLQKYKLSPQALAKHEKLLSGKAHYPITSFKTTSYVVASGAKHSDKALTLGSKTLPKMVYVWFVARDTIENIHSDPFFFEDEGCIEIYLECDGKKFPSSIGYTPDYSTLQYSKDYRMFQREIGFPLDSIITKDSWDSGHNIYAFNLTGDRSVNCDYISPREEQTAPLNLHIDFGDGVGNKGLEYPVTVFVMMEHDRTLVLDENRQPYWDA